MKLYHFNFNFHEWRNKFNIKSNDNESKNGGSHGEKNSWHQLQRKQQQQQQQQQRRRRKRLVILLLFLTMTGCLTWYQFLKFLIFHHDENDNDNIMQVLRDYPMVDMPPLPRLTIPTSDNNSNNHNNNNSNNNTQSSSSSSQQHDISSSFSACLLVMDDNHYLIEWLAYHYQVLPLRRLIIAKDPRSKTSPTDILNRWKNFIHITEWDDDDFFHPLWRFQILQQQQEQSQSQQDKDSIVINDENDNDDDNNNNNDNSQTTTTTTKRRHQNFTIPQRLTILHRYRQRFFFTSCMKTLQREHRDREQQQQQQQQQQQRNTHNNNNNNNLYNNSNNNITFPTSRRKLLMLNHRQALKNQSTYDTSKNQIITNVNTTTNTMTATSNQNFTIIKSQPLPLSPISLSSSSSWSSSLPIWVALLDSDEFLAPNRNWKFHQLFPKPTTPSLSSSSTTTTTTTTTTTLTIAHLLSRLSNYKTISSKRCIGLPRLLFGTKEDDNQYNYNDDYNNRFPWTRAFFNITTKMTNNITSAATTTYDGTNKMDFTENNNHSSTAQKHVTFHPKDFLTLRWNWHAPIYNENEEEDNNNKIIIRKNKKNIYNQQNIQKQRRQQQKLYRPYNKAGKTMIDLSRIPSVYIKFQQSDVHRPIKKYCTIEDMWLSNIESPFIIHHYMGTYQQHTFRKDPRKIKTNMNETTTTTTTATTSGTDLFNTNDSYQNKQQQQQSQNDNHNDSYQNEEEDYYNQYSNIIHQTKDDDDSIMFFHGWLNEFIQSVGIDTARMLLEGVGHVEQLVKDDNNENDNNNQQSNDDIIADYNALLESIPEEIKNPPVYDTIRAN